MRRMPLIKTVSANYIKTNEGRAVKRKYTKYIEK